MNPTIVSPEIQKFGGQRFWKWDRNGYYRRRGKFLHREVWEAAVGPIPEGYQIHHKDGDPANNKLANLELVPTARHMLDKHPEVIEANKRRFRENHTTIVEASKEWHRPPSTT
jgi:hypothetical protein